MKQTFKIEITAEVSRHDFYPDASRAGCRRCALYAVCAAVQNMQEQFPYSFVRISELPCHQHVENYDRKYMKFRSK